MLDIKLLREQKEFVVENLKRREGFDISIVDVVLDLDIGWRRLKKELDFLKSQKNKETKRISEIKKLGEDISAHHLKLKDISEQIDEKKLLEKEMLKKRDEQLLKLPNLLSEEVPKGESDEDNVVISTYGKKKEFSFTPKSHQEICELNNWYEIQKAGEVSGARFYYLKSELVLLQIALYNFVMRFLQEKNYIPVEPPLMLRRSSVGCSVSLEDFEDVIYKIEDEDLYLIATSEAPLAVLHKNEVLNHKELPLRYAGISPCFRKEAGVTKDSKGIFRVHNFNKIEQFVFCTPERSCEFHKEIISNAEEIFKQLGLHFQVVDVCSGDIGNFAARKYDLEAWLPSQQKYREMVSASNYKDYGARRLNCRFQSPSGTLEFVHTLNSTAIALTRVIVAIIEQHQTELGDVRLPEVLRNYFGGREFLKNSLFF